MRLGEGTRLAISPDQKWALLAEDNFRRLVAVPTGPGERKVLTHKPMRYWFARWFADGNRIVFTATEPGHGPRIYVQDLAREAEPLSAEGVDIDIPFPSPDGRYVVCSLADSPGFGALMGGHRGWFLTPHTRRTPSHGVPMAGLFSWAIWIGSQPRSIEWMYLPEYGLHGGSLPLKTALELSSLTSFIQTSDERGYAYSYKRSLSELYRVTDLK